MSQPINRRRSPRRRERRINVFADGNHARRPEHLARVNTAAGLEQARREAAARADNEAREADSAPCTSREGQVSAYA